MPADGLADGAEAVPPDSFSALDGPLSAVMARLLREFIRPRWKMMALGLVAMVVMASTSGVLPFLIQRVADEVFVAHNETMLFVLPALIVLVMVVRAGSDWVATVSDAWIGNHVVADARVRMFDTLVGADLSWIQRTHSGRFVSAFVNDAPLIDRAATKTLTTLFKSGLSVAFLVGTMIYMDWRLSILVLGGMPIIMFNLGRQRKRIRRSVKRSLEESGDLGSMLTQTLQSMRVVKAYRQEELEGVRFRRISRNIFDYLMKTARSRAAVGPVSETVSSIGLAGAVLYGGWQGIYGNLTLGHFMGFMTAAMLAYQPLKSLATTQAMLSEGLLATARVFAVIDYASRVVEAPGATPLKVTEGAVSFRNVTFAYDTGESVLRDFSLDIAPGRKVALVGQSGAGKTTVINLALRFFDPTSGQILIDGQDIRTATIGSVRGASALLTQDPVLFDDTIEANIAYGSEGASRAEIEAAAEAAAAADFIARLPEGYATRIGEAGVRLSGGERQRIAFARAMLRRAPILLLDEPTSALDAESEAKVQAAMNRLLRDRTVIMIAHRLSTVKRADLICVMDAGRIVETGTHDELVRRRGVYARMFQTQFAGGEEPRLALARS